jgi:hypothetical protein
MRRLTFIVAMAILVVAGSVQAQKGVPIDKDGGYDFGIQDDKNGNYMLFNSTTGDYYFERCSDGVELQGRGQVTWKDCSLILEEVSFNRYVLVEADLCQYSGRCLVRVFKGLKTIPYVPPMLETLDDSNMTDNMWNCPGEPAK